MRELAQVRTSALEIRYEHSGTTDAPIVVLLHGYPFDVRAFDGVVPILNAAGFRTIVPFLRGYGPTRFLSLDTPRSGEQAALGMDLLELLDALQIRQAILAGFDIHGADDEVNPPQNSEGHQRFFTGYYERRVFEKVGHNPPQEAPEKFARAVLDLCDRTAAKRHT